MIQFPRLPSVPEAWNTNVEQSMLPPRPHPIRDGRTLKQSKSSECLSQRKDRVDFLRRREWTRRVSSNGDQPSIPKRTRTYSWEDIIAAADAAADSWDYDSSAGYPRRPDTIDELDESVEPYIIYTATPRPPAPSNYTPHTPGATVLYATPSPSPSPSPTLSPISTHSPVRDLSPTSLSSAPGSAQYFPRKAWRGPHSRHSSLSSISEEDEGLVRF
ncbi:hypothetical protein BN946_scf184989.g43 [Trametes cinnabarina]|uniref:Uncharacterized protein n=1 Tax=Pycnoporus cinnabarinus TaxID=5643 RepID=A0A060S321_PYCCI|nr:hypothetical protein BN946_scf184989.g43 [Trametes cinnabarina]